MMRIKNLKLSNELISNKINNLLKGLILSDESIKQIKNVFHSELELGLNLQPSSLQMENTFITDLPDRTESGIFLAMDLGGTNLRIILLSLINGEIENELVHYYDLPEKLRIGSGVDLFDFLAECINSFAIEYKLEDNIIYPLGFTFSFPMHQKSVDSGILVTWTKSFNCPSIVGEDVVQILKKSLYKYHRTNIEIVAILNDTTGTLIHGAYLDRHTRIGIVLGTGTNGCYMENADNIKSLQQKDSNVKSVLIDVEWGAFGDNGVLDFIKTDFDKLVDNTSLLKNSFTFEKYIGGKYLGEICRVVLKKLYTDGLFLSTLPIEFFPKPWSFSSNYVSIIEGDTLKNSWEDTTNILQNVFQSKSCSHDDLEVIRYVCGLISLRAAQLVAINTSILLNRLNEDQITVAIDGSLYRNHLRLRNWLIDYTAIWCPTKKTKFILADDGSGKGSALIAAIAKNLNRKH